MPRNAYGGTRVKKGASDGKGLKVLKKALSQNTESDEEREDEEDQ